LRGKNGATSDLNVLQNTTATAARGQVKTVKAGPIGPTARKKNAVNQTKKKFSKKKRKKKK
jgi:hypothetical protein